MSGTASTTEPGLGRRRRARASRASAVLLALLPTCAHGVEALADAAEGVRPHDFLRSESQLVETVVSLGEGRLALADPGFARVVILDRTGREDVRFGRYHLTDAGGLAWPIDVATSGGRWHVADRHRHSIEVFAADGSHVASWRDASGRSEPVAVEALEDGTLLVLDAALNTLTLHAADGATLRTLGEFGRGVSGFNCPHDFTLIGDVAYVADSGNRRIQRYRLDGKCLEPFGQHGEDVDEFEYPTGVAVAPDGMLLVVDHYGHRVQVFDPERGCEIADRRLELDGIASYPMRIAVLDDGDCAITCPQSSKIVVTPCP